MAVSQDEDLRPVARGGERRHVMVLEDRLQALARAFRPGGDGHALACLAQMSSAWVFTAS